MIVGLNDKIEKKKKSRKFQGHVDGQLKRFLNGTKIH